VPFPLLGTLALATAALAGGWAQVTFTDAPVDPPAGVGTPIGFRVMQHGQTPVSWPEITVVATDSESGVVVRAAARAEGPTGQYVATINFPTEGDWTLTFESSDLIMEGTATMQVSPATATPTSPAATPDPTPFGIAAAVGLALLVGGALALRLRRGNRRTEPVSASS
jgi:hypothetical protein